MDRLDKAEPAAIGLDILLDRPSDPAADQALAAALGRSRAPVVLVSDPGLAARRAICGGRGAAGAAASQLLPDFRSLARVGDGVICGDAVDDVVRTARSGGRAAPSFAAALDQAMRPGAPSRLAREAGFRPVFNLTADGQPPFPIYSASLLDDLDPAWLKGRAVIVGAISPYSGDWFQTPVRFAHPRLPIEPADLMPEGVVPGVVVHAYALASMLNGKAAPAISWPLRLALVIAGAVIGALMGMARWPLWLAGCVLAAALAGYWALAFQAPAMGLPLLPFSGFAAALLLAAGGVYALMEGMERRQRQFIHRSFSHFLAPEIVDLLAREPERLRLEAEERELTTLFTDLEGFTTFVDTNPPALVSEALNSYLDCIIEAVLRHQGVVDKIVGDAVHALFSVPLADPEHRENALRCAVDIVAATERHRAEWARRGVKLGITRIGVNSGRAQVGNFGGPRRFDYTAHGSTINIAARLEAANKEFGTRVCVSAAARVDLPGLVFREIGAIPVRGVGQPVLVYELVFEFGAPSAD